MNYEYWNGIVMKLYVKQNRTLGLAYYGMGGGLVVSTIQQVRLRLFKSVRLGGVDGAVC